MVTRISAIGSHRAKPVPPLKPAPSLAARAVISWRFLGVTLAILLGAQSLAGAQSPTSSPPGSSPPGPWIRYKERDPKNYMSGWTNSHWLPTIQRLWVWGGDSHNPRGNNSVRLFDPATGAWTIAFPNNNGRWLATRELGDGLPNRDNHASFFVPGRGEKGEVWVLGGSVSPFGGRWDVARNQWVSVGETPGDFARGLIANLTGAVNQGPWAHVENTAHDWCAALDTGVMFGGDQNGSPSNQLRLIEPNPGGPEPYRFTVIQGQAGSPPRRGRGQGHAVCAGKSLYVYGGRGDTQAAPLRDLWRLDVARRTWTRLADAPAPAVHALLKYDSVSDVLILSGLGYRGVYVYHIDTNSWETMPPGVEYGRSNHNGDYAPSVGQLLLTGGYVYFPDGRQGEKEEGSRIDGYRYESEAQRPTAAPSRGRVVVPPGAPDASAQAERAPRVVAKTAATAPASASEAPAIPAVAKTGATPAAPRGALVAQASPAESPAPAPATEQSAPATPGGRVELPANTWVARPLPGAGRSPTAGKHMRLTVNPVNGRIYFLGGDYRGPGAADSGRNEIYSYSVASNTWVQEQPYCAAAGAVQAWHPDEVGWAYDTKRNIFWMIPGYMGGPEVSCPSTQVPNRVMTFDPATRTWTDPKRPGLEQAGVVPAFHKFAQYDPVRDSLVVMSGDAVLEFPIAAGRWVKHWRQPGPGTIRLGQEYSAMDAAARVIYAIDGVAGRLYQYGLDNQRLTDLGPHPRGPGRESSVRLVWDSVNKVLIWPHEGDGQDLLIYEPRAKRWRQQRPAVVGADRVGAASITFDPGANAVVALDYFKDVIFLYRYAAE